ncbi:MAG: ABC-type transport auxiliary lipoprotein family protein, partial [Chromatiaceae bacterium]
QWPSTAMRRSDRVIRVDSVTAPAWLQGRTICYRLDYYNRGEMASYSRSQWAAPVPSMIGQVVQDVLARSRAWKAVIGPGDDTKATVDLQLHLLNLCQEFSSPKQSTGALAARVTVSVAASGRVIGQRELTYREPAPTPDAAGGVTAERKAVAKLSSDLAKWVAGLSL